MSSHPNTRATAAGYRALLRDREFAGLFLGFMLTVAAGTLSGFALGTLVDDRTGSPFLTAVSMYGATFATVLGALTLMSVADGRRPRRTLVALHLLTLVGVATQAVPGLPLGARFCLLLTLGFFQALGTGVRLGLLVEIVPDAGYATARSLMNVTSGGVMILGYAVGAVLLRRLDPQGVFVVAAALTGLALLVVAATVREHSIRLTRRPGPRETWRANVELFSHPGRRALLLNLWVPNGLVVGCAALFIADDAEWAGVLLAASSAGMLLGDLAVGRMCTAELRWRLAFPMRLLLAAPYLLFVLDPPRWPLVGAVFVAGAGFSASLALQERLLALTPEAVRGQTQGVESAGRLTCQGLGAALAGGVAQWTGPAAAMAALAAASLAVTLASRPWVSRAGRG
ncbi:MFS transporter [Streptomyces millisiae]|uniref:MFS transporter n=1 Tax=Streptomyces millisiae TaxID=3075542 RepID=A0ABU2LQJ5_9ACTN|nr:MFS transporter [Streptomyces sp. DSM 44918]MDT0319862.1 MFS transporter [Streptomyces sp. DSM 44918]